MSDAPGANGREADSIPDGGILAALPRARPQRTTARRTAARSGKQTNARKPTAARASRATSLGDAPAPPPLKAASAGAKRTASKPTTKPRVGPTAKRRVKPTEPPAPKQGYEPEEEVELGTTVHPPSGVELVESVADIMGELAGTGLAAGGRLLKDALSILRRP